MIFAGDDSILVEIMVPITNNIVTIALRRVPMGKLEILEQNVQQMMCHIGRLEKEVETLNKYIANMKKEITGADCETRELKIVGSLSVANNNIYISNREIHKRLVKYFRRANFKLRDVGGHPAHGGNMKEFKALILGNYTGNVFLSTSHYIHLQDLLDGLVEYNYVPYYWNVARIDMSTCLPDQTVLQVASVGRNVKRCIASIDKVENTTLFTEGGSIMAGCPFVRYNMYIEY